MRLQEWLDTEVRPFRDKPISWISQYHFFRDPMRPTYSDTSCFFSPADGIVLYQRTISKAVVRRLSNADSWKTWKMRF